MNKLAFLVLLCIPAFSKDILKSERKYQAAQSNKLYRLQRDQENLIDDWKNHCVLLGKQLSQKLNGQLDCIFTQPPTQDSKASKAKENQKEDNKSK